LLIQFKPSSPVDHFPDAQRLTPARARALARMMTEPKRRDRIPLHLLPAACTLNALAMAGMDAGRIAQRTGLTVQAATAFLAGFTLGGSL
jgi:hypothetical protein